MKKLIISAICVLAALGAYGQGTINFTNFNPPLDAPVFDIGGMASNTRLDGSGFMAQLYAGPVGGTLEAIGAASPFLSGAGAGYFNGGTRTIATVAPGVMADVQVRAWNVGSGSTFEAAMTAGTGYGMSGTLTLVTGGDTAGGTQPPTSPSALSGLQSFELVGGGTIPEPSTIALGLLGAGLLVFRRRK
jgi:hypothetical protein